MQKDVGDSSALCVYHVPAEHVVDTALLSLDSRAAFFASWCSEKLVEYTLPEVHREASWGG